MGDTHDELLAAAVEAHRGLEAVAEGLEEAQEGRRQAFGAVSEVR